MTNARWTFATVMGAWLVAALAGAQSPAGPTRVASAVCSGTATRPTSPAPRTAPAESGNADARGAAQRALGFLVEEVARWQGDNRCYGCHVQAVSLEALSVGRANGYDVAEASFQTVLRGLRDLPGGARTQAGLSYHETMLLEPSNAFGGAAFARFDELVDGRASGDLVRVATRLEQLQQEDGSIGGNYVNGPVAVGTVQSTTQAVQAFRQAHARTADERWLRPIRRAEDYLARTARQLLETGGAELQQLDYAVLGLLAAGARESEETLQGLGRAIRAQQQEDGSWGSALLTGQALYALRRMGASDDDAAVRRGTAWLVGAQQRDGGWGLGGASRGTAMWALLGLVSIDVASIEIAGVADGQHVATAAQLTGLAVDNERRRIERTELFLDDVRVASACGAHVAFSLDPSRIEPGRHILRAVATSDAGRTGTKRIEIYTGDHYLTQAGARWVDEGTVVSVRDIAPSSLGHRVVLEVFATRQERGATVRGASVHREERPGAPGALEMRWSGRERGRFVAELQFVDAAGRVRQTLEVPFVHDAPEARRAQFGQVAGSLTLDEGGNAQNTEVELVDDHGRVVARARTTDSGRYRFNDVEAGRYRVRARREGLGAVEAPVTAAPAAETGADMRFH